MGIQFTETQKIEPTKEPQIKPKEECLTCPKIFIDPTTGRASMVINNPKGQEIIEPGANVGHVTTTNGGSTHIGSGAHTGNVYTSGEGAETNIGVIKK